MALTIAPAGHDTTSMEEQRTCVADICQICPEWYPLIGPGVPFPVCVSLGFGILGILGILESDCFQIKAAAKRARLA